MVVVGAIYIPKLFDRKREREKKKFFFVWEPRHDIIIIHLGESLVCLFVGKQEAMRSEADGKRDCGIAHPPKKSFFISLKVLYLALFFFVFVFPPYLCSFMGVVLIARRPPGGYGAYAT